MGKAWNSLEMVYANSLALRKGTKYGHESHHSPVHMSENYRSISLMNVQSTV